MIRHLIYSILLSLALIACGQSDHPPPPAYSWPDAADTSVDASDDTSTTDSGSDGADSTMPDVSDDTSETETTPVDSGIDTAEGDSADASDASDDVVIADSAVDTAAETSKSLALGCKAFSRDLSFDAQFVAGAALTQAAGIKGFGSDLFVATGNSAASGSLHWNGAAWQPEMLPATMISLNGIAGASASDLWLVGDDATPRGHAFHWDGTGWTMDTGTPPVNHIVDISVFPSGDVYIIGGSSGSRLWKKGATGWTTLAMPTMPPGTVLSRMWGFSIDSYFIAGAVRDASGAATAGALYLYDGASGGWKGFNIPTELLEVTNVFGQSTLDFFVTGVTAQGGSVYHVALNTWTAYPDSTISRYTAVWSPRIGYALAAGIDAASSSGMLRLTVINADGTTNTFPVDAQAGLVKSFWVESNGTTIHFVHEGYGTTPAGHYVGTCQVH